MSELYEIEVLFRKNKSHPAVDSTRECQSKVDGIEVA